MLLDRLDVNLGGARARRAGGVGCARQERYGRLVTSQSVRCVMSEETDNIAVEENVDKHLQKDVEENQNILETLRGKVREKLKNPKINQGEKSSTHLLTDDKIYQWSKVSPQTKVSLDEGLSFFILNGEEGSALGKSSVQRSVNDGYPKHISPGDNLQNFAEGQDEYCMEEVTFPDLLEVKAAEYKDDQEYIKKQQANIFVPSSSPGKVVLQ
ncbi:protein CC2D2B homolog [Manis javanica]|uniref:protein CC2D2B homolog n=1 Tax=Manis javanica TaxID=9974 RepID=UPI003C6D7FD0